MDRSFLSNDTLIKASQKFVCIRLATYEDKKETAFLTKIYTGRSGELENTVFCLLTPDGKQPLSRAGRSPNFSFHSPSNLADEIVALSAKYPAKPVKANSSPVFPKIKNFRLGLNVASCDNLPCVVIIGKDKQEVEKTQAKLNEVIWSDEIAGRFVFCSTTKIDDLKDIQDAEGKTIQITAGILAIQPGTYGIDGTVLEAIKLDLDAKELGGKLISIAKAFEFKGKNHSQHVRSGNRQGIQWETEVPVTDPDSIRAMERNQANRKR